MIWLTWTIPVKAGKREPDFTGFSVWRSKISILKSDCKNCPVQFEVIKQIPVAIPSLKDPYKDKMFYDESVEGGFRYIYKVIGHTEDGRTSGGSNLVEFVIKRQK